MSLIFDPGFRAVVQRFKYEAPEIINMTMTANIVQMQKVAVQEARSQLRNLVYNAPLPESAYSDWWTPETYMQMRRVGTVWNAVKADPPKRGPNSATGEVKVDQTNFEDFYYAYVLNKGAQSISYAARPFWTVMERRMRTMLRSFGDQVLKDTKASLIVGKAK